MDFRVGIAVQPPWSIRAPNTRTPGSDWTLGRRSASQEHCGAATGHSTSAPKTGRKHGPEGHTDAQYCHQYVATRNHHPTSQLRGVTYSLPPPGSPERNADRTGRRPYVPRKSRHQTATLPSVGTTLEDRYAGIRTRRHTLRHTSWRCQPLRKRSPRHRDRPPNFLEKSLTWRDGSPSASAYLMALPTTS